MSLSPCWAVKNTRHGEPGTHGCGTSTPSRPAIEGRSIAFRYEIEASTRGRLGLRERAAETPIGFDVVTR